MPFSKIKAGKDKGKYSSPSGRVFTSAQVRLYYATNGFTEGVHNKKAVPAHHDKARAKK